MLKIHLYPKIIRIEACNRPVLSCFDIQFPKKIVFKKMYLIKKEKNKCTKIKKSTNTPNINTFLTILQISVNNKLKMINIFKNMA